MDLLLGQRVRDLVGKNARGQARKQFLNFELPAAFHDGVVDNRVLAVELDLLRRVGVQSADLGGQVDDMGGLLSLEQVAGLFHAEEVAVLGGEEDPVLIGLSLGE